jgi:hypothetical protein
MKNTFNTIEKKTLKRYQAIEDIIIVLLYLRGAIMGSPIMQFANMPPEKIYIMEEAHNEKGCFLENGLAPS